MVYALPLTEKDNSMCKAFESASGTSVLWSEIFRMHDLEKRPQTKVRTKIPATFNNSIF